LGLMPGDLMTISKACSRSAIACVSMDRCASPSATASAASASLQNSVSGKAGKRERTA